MGVVDTLRLESTPSVCRGARSEEKNGCHGCIDGGVGRVNGKRQGWSNGGWMEEGVEQSRGTGKTGVEGLSLSRRMLGSDGFQVVASAVEELS